MSIAIAPGSIDLDIPILTYLRARRLRRSQRRIARTRPTPRQPVLQTPFPDRSAELKLNAWIRQPPVKHEKEELFSIPEVGQSPIGANLVHRGTHWCRERHRVSLRFPFCGLLARVVRGRSTGRTLYGQVEAWNEIIGCSHSECTGTRMPSYRSWWWVRGSAQSNLAQAIPNEVLTNGRLEHPLDATFVIPREALLQRLANLYIALKHLGQ